LKAGDKIYDNIEWFKVMGVMPLSFDVPDHDARVDAEWTRGGGRPGESGYAG
jgi:hypothetical protein